MEKTYKVTENDISEFKDKLIQNGGSLDGKHFDIKGITGTVSYSDGIMKIIIKDKPWLVSWGTISDKLDEYINK